VIVADTSLLIDHLRGDPHAHTILSNALERHQRLDASVLTKVEVLAGVRSGEEAATQQLFSLFEWVPVDEVLADHAGGLARHYFRSKTVDLSGSQADVRHRARSPAVLAGTGP